MPTCALELWDRGELGGHVELALGADLRGHGAARVADHSDVRGFDEDERHPYTVHAFSITLKRRTAECVVE